jgi:hypothetical protein
MAQDSRSAQYRVRDALKTVLPDKRATREAILGIVEMEAEQLDPQSLGTALNR